VINPVIFLSNVPWWVVPLLALLVWRGWHASKARIMPLRAIFLGPAIFIGWGIANLVTRALAAPSLAAIWFAAALLGTLLALTTVRIAVQADRAKGMVRLPGSWWPLARYLAIFGAKFVLAAWSAMQPAMRPELAYWDVGVSGVSAGYFLGWLICVLREVRGAPLLEAAGP
jgi:hypothetical protein